MKRLLILFSALFLFCGCGNSGKELDSATKKQFTEAIASYCSSKSMGMKVKSIQSAEIKGNQASVVCKMEEAGGLYNLAPKWTIKFQKKNGKWTATEHSNK